MSPVSARGFADRLQRRTGFTFRVQRRPGDGLHHDLWTTGVDDGLVGLIPVADPAYEHEHSEKREKMLSEAVVSPTSPLIGQSISQSNFRAHYNAAVVAVHRGGARLAQARDP